MGEGRVDRHTAELKGGSGLRGLGATLNALCGSLCLWGFLQARHQHGGYVLRQVGVQHVPEGELAFYAWYLLWGLAAALFYTLAVLALSRASAWTRLVALLGARSVAVVACAGALVVVVASLVRHLLLAGQAITDDEEVYTLIASTLERGRLVNYPPLPAMFLENRFVVVGDDRWFGKYPVGHALLLLVGRLVGTAGLIVPLLGAAGVWCVYLIAREIGDSRRAVVAVALLAMSPHFVLTHATTLSQTTSTFVTLLAVLACMRASSRGSSGWAALAGIAMAYGVLVRPLPCGLFACVIGAGLIVGVHLRGDRRASAKVAGIVFVTLLAAGLALLAINRAQVGSAVASAYQEYHGSLGLFDTREGALPNSVGGALLRQNFWLFGWPLSLVFVPFARVGRASFLLWGLIVAEYAYRVIVPKTVVATTGPIYVTEIVPLLAVLSADGMFRVKEMLSRAGVARASDRVAGFAVASSLVAVLCFYPFVLRALFVAGQARAQAIRDLARQGEGKRLVFANLLVHPESGFTWAYYPPNPHPDLSDDMLFLRLPSGADGAQRAWSLWRERFSDRDAVVFVPTERGNFIYALDPSRPLDASAMAAALEAFSKGG